MKLRTAVIAIVGSVSAALVVAIFALQPFRANNEIVEVDGGNAVPKSEVFYGCNSQVCLSSPPDTQAGSNVGSKLLTSSGGLDWTVKTSGNDLHNAKISFGVNDETVNDRLANRTFDDFLTIGNITIHADRISPEDTFSIITRQENGTVTVNTTSIESVPMTIHLDVERAKVTYGKTTGKITLFLNPDSQREISDSVHIISYGLEPLDHIKEKNLGGVILGGIIELRFDKPYYDEGLERIAELEDEGYSIESLTSEATSDWHDHPTTAYVVILKHRNEPSP